MKLSALFFALASACTVLATPMPVETGLVARNPLVCDLRSSSSMCIHLPHRPKAYSPRLEAGSPANCRLETGGGSSSSCPTDSSRLVNTRYHSDERARPCIHLPNSSLSFVFPVFNLLTETHLKVLVSFCSTINRSGHFALFIEKGGLIVVWVTTE
ncbi:hypothetical protein EV424DRAFT_1409305 [Suillus variegatus]|nr:hypothetical protein EV424DRAFT_1409305 [Suillus variegatus]